MLDTISLLDDWFGKLPQDKPIPSRKMEQWFGKDPAVDERLRKNYGGLLESFEGTSIPPTVNQALECLAWVVLFDQFSRNVYRNDARAYGYDGLARSLARRGLDLGAEEELSPVYRAFLYLPFEHSEALTDQELSVDKFQRLLKECPAAQRESFQGFLDYAERHREIIARFGRFPHRNAALGRRSTEEEVAFLKTPGSSF